ncbi:hypothetical protein SUDANB37_03461 [Streptomyces sp. enrichment culture]
MAEGRRLGKTKRPGAGARGVTRPDRHVREYIHSHLRGPSAASGILRRLNPFGHNYDQRSLASVEEYGTGQPPSKSTGNPRSAQPPPSRNRVMPRPAGPGPAARPRTRPPTRIGWRPRGHDRSGHTRCPPGPRPGSSESWIDQGPGHARSPARAAHGPRTGPGKAEAQAECRDRARPARGLEQVHAASSPARSAPGPVPGPEPGRTRGSSQGLMRRPIRPVPHRARGPGHARVRLGLCRAAAPGRPRRGALHPTGPGLDRAGPAHAETGSG